jgi:hypothetical protein
MEGVPCSFSKKKSDLFLFSDGFLQSDILNRHEEVLKIR